MGVSDSNGNAGKWSIGQGMAHGIDESDAIVEGWKKSWLAGANACWATKAGINPSPDGPAGAAWQAGWEWAKGHPDRRKTQYLRLAHPHRRATDPVRRVPRAVKIGAFGVGLFAASRWVWRALITRRKPGGA